MRGHVLSKAAEDDLAEIARYTIVTYGVEQAIAYRDGFIRAFECLAQFPRAARERPDLRQHSRVHPCQAHLIVTVSMGTAFLNSASAMVAKTGSIIDRPALSRPERAQEAEPEEGSGAIGRCIHSG